MSNDRFGPYQPDGHLSKIYRGIIPNIFEESLSGPSGKQKIPLRYGLEADMNHDSHRSDDFGQPSNKHILFLGCSETFGLGNRIEDIWSFKLKNMIDESSKFFNLALVSGSMEEIISNAFAYFKIYGNPEIIFFLAPEMHRGLNESFEITKLRIFQFYNILEIYCAKFNIRLISSTWDIYPKHHINQTTNDFMSEYFDTFYKLNKDTLASLVYEFIQKNKNIDHPFIAKDSRHLGIAQNDAIANFFYSIYNEPLTE